MGYGLGLRICRVRDFEFGLLLDPLATQCSLFWTSNSGCHEGDWEAA